MGEMRNESEDDLADMVNEFLESGNSDADGTSSGTNSDSESGFSPPKDISIVLYKHKMDQHERDLSSLVQSLIISMNRTDLKIVKSGPCNASCLRYSLVKLLKFSGYDAAVCTSNWPKSGKVPGGDHEYIDVIIFRESGRRRVKRIIIDIDFRSHFQIARAVKPYDELLELLPIVFVGSLYKLEQFLKLMVDAAKCSLKHNSMPLPPWRSRAYLQAKWQSTYERRINPDEQCNQGNTYCDHLQCAGYLSKLKSSLHSKIELERILKPLNNEDNWRLNLERRPYDDLHIGAQEILMSDN